MINTAETSSQQQEASLAIFAKSELGLEASARVLGALGDAALILATGYEVDGASVFTPDDFQYFESQQSPQEAARVEYTRGLLEGYESFKGKVDAILAELKHKPAKELESFLASGNESDVFTIERDGKPFAVRVSKGSAAGGKYSKAANIDLYLAGAHRAADIDGMEKLVGLSYEDGVTVGEIIPGKPMAEYSAEEIAAIPQDHYRKLARTAVEAAEAGITLDGNEGNLLYDPESGFGFVDFGVLSAENRAIAQLITPSVFGTDTWLPRGEIPATEHVEDYQTLKKVLAATVPTYDRWLTTLVEVQREMGRAEDYLTGIDKLEETSTNLAVALEELSVEGAAVRFAQGSFDARQKKVEHIRKQAEALEDGFMREHKLENLDRHAQTPDMRFPKGTLRPTRNDAKK